MKLAFPPGDTFDPESVTWVTDNGDLAALRQAILSSSLMVMDLETTGLNEHERVKITRKMRGRGKARAEVEIATGTDASIVLASITLPQPDDPDPLHPTTWLVPLSHPESPWSSIWVDVMTSVAKWVRAAKATLENHNVKFDCRWVKAHTGVDLTSKISWDPQIGAHLLDENHSTKLKEVVPRLIPGVERWDDYDLSESGAALRVPLEGLGLYAARDTYWTWRLGLLERELMYVDASEDEPPYFSEEIVNARLGRLMTWCAIPQCSALTSMEQRGIKLDVEWAENLRDEFTQVIPQLQNDLVEPYPELDRTGMSFAPTATWFRAWADAAVEHGDLHIAALTKTGRPQWGKGVLTRQARGGSEVAEKLLNLRGASKRLEYLTSWLATRAPDDRIYANYNQGSVVTGRLSSCVSPDTLIEMPRDMTKYPDGVPLREVKAGDWVYSFDVNMELTLRQVEWVGPTKTDKTVIVTFENSEGEQRTLTCTPDHLVRLYNGDWRHAAYLMKNANGYSEGSTASTRVLSMVRRGWKEPSGNDRYLQFFPHSNSRHTSPSVSPGSRNGSTAGGKNQEHRWVMGRVLGRKLSTKWDVNHRDGNKVNNHPSNLEYLPASEHRSNTHRDGTWGKAQPGSTSYIGPSDFRAVSVEPGPTIEVWDMTVPEDHQFIANGIVVHNSGPNMQQITHSLKPAFVPDPGFVIIDADFSQIELRIAAFISRCEPMIQAYRDGKDLHRMMAAQIINHQRRAEWVRIWGETALDEGSLILPEDVGDVERQAGKAANFGLLYGMGAFGFREYAETVYGVSFTLEEAHIVHAAFFDLWEGLRKWHIDTGTRASRDEQVVSPIGRIRRLPEINSADDKAASGAYRQAINAPVQGFASDMMQIAAAAVGGYMPRVPGIKGAQLLGTVHDSIFLQAPEDQWERVARQTQQYMVELVPRILKKMDCDFDVPLEAGVKVGTRYGLADVGAF